MIGGTQKEIEKLQDNLLALRKIAGWTAEELGDCIGVTKQTIRNLENGITAMSKTQYIAIRVIFDYEIKENPNSSELAQAIRILLDTDELSSDDQAYIGKLLSTIPTVDKTRRASTVAGIVAVVAAAGIGVAAGVGGAWLAKIIGGKK